MRMPRMWGQCATIVGLSIALQFAIAAPPEPPIPRAAGGGAGEHLNAALAAYHRNDFEGAYAEAAAAASDAGFLAQDEGTRHTTLSLAAEVALKTNRPEQAQHFAAQATQLPEQSLADWRNRLFAAMRTHDAGDEAESLTKIANRWGRDPANLQADTVERVLRDTREAQFRAARLELLQTLYELRWQPGRGRSASREWRDLSLLLLENGDLQRAQQVASLINDPYEIIAMRADLRYRPLVKGKFFDSDAKRAATRQIDALQAAIGQQPRSLVLVARLAEALVRTRRETEAIAAVDRAESRIAQSAGGTTAYDDSDANYSWILNAKAYALRNLGRFDEAVKVLQQAVELPHRVDLVSQSVNLGELLVGLDRPGEAEKCVPPLEKASEFGKAQIYLVLFTIALQRDDRPEADRALTYLREHRADAPDALQAALLRAGAMAEAQQVLLDRLADPVLRSAALVDMQIYFERTRAPKEAEWRARALKLGENPAVREAIAKVGVVERYMWRYPGD
jgi:tetratricopeptide (TPR) repeat protein